MGYFVSVHLEIGVGLTVKHSTVVHESKGHCLEYQAHEKVRLANNTATTRSYVATIPSSVCHLKMHSMVRWEAAHLGHSAACLRNLHSR